MKTKNKSKTKTSKTPNKQTKLPQNKAKQPQITTKPHNQPTERKKTHPALF